MSHWRLLCPHPDPTSERKHGPISHLRMGVTMEKVSVGAATLEINIEAKAATNLRPWRGGNEQQAVCIRGVAEGKGGARGRR